MGTKKQHKSHKHKISNRSAGKSLSRAIYRAKRRNRIEYLTRKLKTKAIIFVILIGFLMMYGPKILSMF